MYLQHKKQQKNKPMFGLALLFACLWSAHTFAGPVSAPAIPLAPCAILEDFAGDVELIDPARSRILETAPQAGIPCSAWISTKQGWGKVRLRDGHWINLGSNTFVQFPEPQGDHVVVYRGEVFAQTGEGSGELRVLTANARARIKLGSSIVLYNQADEESQLIALNGSSYFENRFEPESGLKVKAGEASDLNFRALRTVPSTPRVVSVALLKPMFLDLKLSERGIASAFDAVEKRKERKFASLLVDDSGEVTKSKSPNLRAPAAITSAITPEEKQKAQENIIQKYGRHPPSKDDAALNTYLSRKIVAGQDVGEKILFPDRFYGRPQEVKVLIVDPLGTFKERHQKEELAEKAKIIEELSRIRSE